MDTKKRISKLHQNISEGVNELIAPMIFYAKFNRLRQRAEAWKMRFQNMTACVCNSHDQFVVFQISRKIFFYTYT